MAGKHISIEWPQHSGVANFDRRESESAHLAHIKGYGASFPIFKPCYTSCMGFHHGIRNRKFRFPVRACSLTILVITLFATFAWADVLKIGSLLTNPELYAMKIIRLTGVVSDDPTIKHIKKKA